MNRKTKEMVFALSLVVVGSFSVFYGVWNYVLFITLQHAINFAWFLLFLLSGIALAVLGAVYIFLSFAYFNRIKRINKSLE
jgi:hypothetical protein